MRARRRNRVAILHGFPNTNSFAIFNRTMVADMQTKRSNPKWSCIVKMASDLGIVSMIFCCAQIAHATAPSSASNSVAPTTPREFFNAGTQQLREKKFREAEAFFESALASQNTGLQPLALYNLGHVRFDQGAEELKKEKDKGTPARARSAEQNVSDAIRRADEALASDDLQQLLAAYINGKGARKEARQALEAVRRAMEARGAVLRKWERASGDFKSAVELNAKDGDARQNAEIVDRSIAKLVDSLRELQQCNSGLCNKKNELGQKMKQLKGKIPGGQMPPGAAGDEDEEEDEQNPFGQKDPGPLGDKQEQKEGPSRDGKEMMLTPEQAGWLLEGFKLDSERRLPMGQGPEAKPRDRNRPTW